ncbi:DUF3352 domain-containing protein [Leptolyngbya sp. NIES-2104]|uniref:DUF3352 domain-containing protein n=1 Tax=Leptolyngbya sp. NIES-2104 TaxID=1552121 RepID=UPI0006ECA5A0|nr:DUF3352 domain-containing protein [Leptolyngbya sp. NIES-2104]GAP98299.1 hypothetical protein NIES2104_48530 [Leptolyngbya sp. NIES-2104]
MKFRSFLNIVAAIAGVLFVVATIGFSWVFSQSPLGLLKGSPKSTPTAAMFVPKQAPVMASLLVNPDRLESLRQVVAKPGDRAATRQEFEQFTQGVLGSSELNYRRDVQPWLGDEITAAVTTLDIDREESNGKEAGYLLALATKDTERSREFLQVFWQKRAITGTDLAFEDYKGTKIIYGKVESDSVPITVASAIVGRQYVLFANSPKVLRNAINNVQAAELNLENSSDYQTAIASLDQGRIGVIFANLPALAELNGKEITDTASSAAIALGLDRKGLIAETAIIRAGTDANLSKQSLEALKYIPAVTPISASGVNLDRLWSGLSSDGTISKWVNSPIESLGKRWNLNLPQDIFNWVKGEYALALIPGNTLDWVFVADKTADPGAESAIAHLDELGKAQGITAGIIQIGDQPVSVWTKLDSANADKKIDAEVVGVHTTIGKYEIFTTSMDTMKAVLNAKKDVLANSKSFESAIAALQKENAGYLYLDWKTAQPILEKQYPILKVAELAGEPIFEHLRLLTISNYGNRSGVQRGGVFVRLS